MMLSRRDVAAIAENHGLSTWATRLSEIVEPGWQLCRDDTTDPSVPGACKLGGGPDLAANETWPVNDRGISLTFLAQIDCSALPAWVPGWGQAAVWSHGSQLLRFFANLVDNPGGTDPACILSCAPGIPLRRIAPPPLPEPWPTGGSFDGAEPEERHVQLAEAGLTACPFVGVPTYPPVDRLPFLSDPELEARYQSWEDATMYQRDGVTSRPAHWLLGPAVSTNIDDVRSMVRWSYAATAADDQPAAGLQDVASWACLLHVSDDESLGVDLGGGALTVVVPREDLARGDYRRAFCAVQI